jgi:hypothetical protein
MGDVVPEVLEAVVVVLEGLVDEVDLVDEAAH